MNQKEMFKDGIFVSRANAQFDTFSVLRSKFKIDKLNKATLRVLGLGMFYAYINGNAVSQDRYLPLSSDFSAGHDPADEILSGHRIYVPSYDVTDLLHRGENVLAVHFGGGWYTNSERPFGTPKVIFRMTVETDDGSYDIVSSEKDKINSGIVTEYDFNKYETHDYRIFDRECFSENFDDSNWDYAVRADQVDTNYLFSDCPPDRVSEKLQVKLLSKDKKTSIYDCGKNISGVPVLKISASSDEKITVNLSEELDADGNLDPKYCHNQYYCCYSDKKDRIVFPEFLWFGFRYLRVIGNAELLYVEVIHADTPATCSFKSDNEVLNYLFDAFINTQLCNMHSGIPSDCPHLEKRGYTGDGQLICRSALMMLDAKDFYRKWIDDIADCQDSLSGHIQYTAPYIRSGGGPGGWGCAIIEVPYQYYVRYGDADVLRLYYTQMQRYFDYLEAHSENGLVVSDKEGEWCLGDWCSPEQMILPPPFVNTYFYIKSLARMVEIAQIIGKESDIEKYNTLINEKKKTLTETYFDNSTGNFIDNKQGANAFAVDIGLGDERTYRNLKEYYSGLGRFDTGIFGTDIVTRVLFEHYDTETALSLLCSEDEISFGGQQKKGATSLWEYWTAGRSHSHPMFGAVTSYLFEYVLGIQQVKGSTKFAEILISPQITTRLKSVRGHITSENGKIAVEYTVKKDSVDFCFNIPQKTSATFCFNGQRVPLKAGKTCLSLNI